MQKKHSFFCFKSLFKTFYFNFLKILGNYLKKLEENIFLV